MQDCGCSLVNGSGLGGWGLWAPGESVRLCSREKVRASPTLDASHRSVLGVDQFSQRESYIMSNIIPKHHLGPCGDALFH